MSLHGLRKAHVGLIAKNHARFSIRSGTGLIFSLITLLAGLVIAAIFLDPASALESGDEVGKAKIAEIAIGAIKWLTDASDTQVQYWLLDNPALVSAFLFVFVLFVPFMVCLGAFNQLSGDIGSRGIRYQLLRTERANLLIGRFLGTYLFCLAIYGLLFFVVSIFVIAQQDIYAATDVMLWMLRGFFVVAIYSLPYVAFCALISCAIGSPFGSMALSSGIVGLTPLVIWFVGRKWEPAEYVGYLTPWKYRLMLFDPDPVTMLAAVAAMLAFTGVFLFLGVRHFERRDL
jgi:ABC-type transport system involved in multi-copper enzyme maturation permease subunit